MGHKHLYTQWFVMDQRIPSCLPNSKHNQLIAFLFFRTIRSEQNNLLNININIRKIMRNWNIKLVTFSKFITISYKSTKARKYICVDNTYGPKRPAALSLRTLSAPKPGMMSSSYVSAHFLAPTHRPRKLKNSFWTKNAFTN